MLTRRIHLVAAFAIAAICSAAIAQNTNYPPPVDHSGSQKASQEVRTAENEMMKANVSLAAAVGKLKKQFEDSAEFKAALEAQKTAKAEFEAVRKPLMDALNEKPEYRAAKAAKEKAEADKERVINSNSTTPEERLAAANAVLQAASVASKMESESLVADPKYTEAKNKLTEATAKVAAMNKEFEASVKNNGDWSTAKAAVDAAKQKIEAARKTLADAIAREREQERQRDQRIAEINNQNRQNNNNYNNNNNNNNYRRY